MKRADRFAEDDFRAKAERLRKALEKRAHNGARDSGATATSTYLTLAALIGWGEPRATQTIKEKAPLGTGLEYDRLMEE